MGSTLFSSRVHASKKETESRDFPVNMMWLGFVRMPDLIGSTEHVGLPATKFSLKRPIHRQNNKGSVGIRHTSPPSSFPPAPTNFFIADINSCLLRCRNSPQRREQRTRASFVLFALLFINLLPRLDGPGLFGLILRASWSSKQRAPLFTSTCETCHRVARLLLLASHHQLQPTLKPSINLPYLL